MDDLVNYVSSEEFQWEVVRDNTSELRLLVSVPTAPCRSRSRVEVPSRSASFRAMARPTAPAPIT